MTETTTTRRPMSRIAAVLLAAGIAVWVVFGVVWLAGGDPRVGHYLPFHLAGVIPGALLSRRLPGGLRGGSR